MESVDFTALQPVETDGHTSKGNQLKWRYAGYWYKADHMGYEGLAECAVSRFLEKSDIQVPFVRYEPARMQYHGKSYTGCRSRDFLPEHAVLLPLEKLYRRFTGKSLALKLAEFPEVMDRIRYTVEQVEQFTGLQRFGEYLTAMLEVDAFFLNEDRHTNNIAVLYFPDADRYDYCPLFDHGLSLLADTEMDFPLGSPLEENLRRIEAKPFSMRFDDQLDAAEDLYGIHLHFDITERDITAALADLAEMYSPAALQRVQALLHKQLRHYAYLLRD